MTSARIAWEALDSCRTAVSTEAGQFGDVGDKLADLRLDASVFGEIGGSGELREAITSVAGKAGEQLHHAERLMGEIARAVDSVSTTMRSAENANTVGFKGVR